jgi:hypothetical protein
LQRKQVWWKKFWGRHAHLSKVTDQKSTAREARKQIDVAQSHTTYQVSMMAEELVWMISVDTVTDIIHPVSGIELAFITLQTTLLNYLKMKDGHQGIAKVDQKSIQMPTCTIIPNTPDAETMISMINKNIAAYLW